MNIATFGLPYSVLISPRFWPPRFSSHRDVGRDLGTDLAAFLAAEIFISPRSWPRSRRVFGRRDFHLTKILAEISVLISPRFWPPRFSSHRDFGRDLGTDLAAFLAAEIFISPRSWPRSRY